MGEGMYPPSPSAVYEARQNSPSGQQTQHIETLEGTWHTQPRVMGLGVGWRAPSMCWTARVTVERDRRVRSGKSAAGTFLERVVTRLTCDATDGGSSAATVSGVFKWTGFQAGHYPSHPLHPPPLSQNGWTIVGWWVGEEYGELSSNGIGLCEFHRQSNSRRRRRAHPSRLDGSTSKRRRF